MSSAKATNDRQDAGNVEARIYDEKITLIYAANPSAIAAIVTAIIVLFLIYEESLPSHVLYGWSIYMAGVVIFRMLVYVAFLRNRPQYSQAVWNNLGIIMAALTGLGWGACSILYFPFISFEEKLVLILVIVAYVTGAVTTTFPIPASLGSIFLPAVIPLVIAIFSEEGKLAFSIGLMLVIFLFFISFAARRLAKLVTDALQLRFANESLVEHLQTEKEKSEKLNEILLREVEERKKGAEKLVAARKEAEEANRIKTIFLANMSHDIRTPMNGIIGMTGLMLGLDLPPKLRKYIENIKVCSDGLLGLLNDILDFSKIEAGQLLIAREDFDFPELLDSIRLTLSYSATEKGIDLNFPGNLEQLPRFLKGDELRLRQVMINLIGNAIKFTHEGSVSVAVAEEKHDGEGILLHFRIKDTGIGITGEKLSSIFDSFSQADASTTREYGGSGLGLAISRQLVEMMGGRIWLESEVGRGSTFHFTAKFERGREENIPKQEEVAAIKKKLRILLVDDNQLNRELAELILGGDGHEVKTAEDGLKALQCYADQTFDLIFMDVQMPVMDGLTACEIIRASEGNRDLSVYSLSAELSSKLNVSAEGQHVPIVAMTANAMEGDRQKCINAGMDGYLTKPFEPQKVRQAIMDCMT